MKIPRLTRVTAVLFAALGIVACEGERTDRTPISKEEATDFQKPAQSLDAETPENASDEAQANTQSPTDIRAAGSSPEVASLIEDMGFSALEDSSQEVFSEDQANAPYCLGLADDAVGVTGTQACQRISKRLASISLEGCEAARLETTQCHSVEGFPILLREFPPLEERTPQGRILVVGGIHGDELTSVSIVFKWIEKLNKHHSGLFHWHVVPMMNPDGVLPRSAQRTNKNGVDLNRNLPSTDWHEKALKYWREKQGENPRRYPGEEPASEPETQWLIDEINAFKPNAIISVHAPYGVVDFDALLLNTAPKSLGKLHLNLLGTYPGSLGNYAGINQNIPVITLELPHAWEMPSEQETTKIWEDIVSWLRKNVNQELADAGVSSSGG